MSIPIFKKFVVFSRFFAKNCHLLFKKATKKANLAKDKLALVLLKVVVEHSGSKLNFWG